MKALIALALLYSTAFAQSPLDIQIAIAIAEAENGQPSPVATTSCPCGCADCQSHVAGAPCPCSCENCTCNKATPAIKVAALPNFAAENLKWDAECRRWLSADGKYASEPGEDNWQLRQWRNEPQYRTERRVVGKQCRNGVCSPVYGDVKVRLPDRRVEVFPEKSAADLPADQQPTPMEGVGAGLRALNPRGQVIVDYGCGHDARWLISAVRDHGAARGIGVEIDPAAAAAARRCVDQAGLSNRIEIRTGDATTVSVPEATVGVAYLFEDVLEQLTPKIRHLDRFVSYVHQVPGLPMRQQGDLWIYEPPQPVAIRAAGAVWNGRVYQRPVCNNPRCSMCNSIRSQLAWN